MANDARNPRVSWLVGLGGLCCVFVWGMGLSNMVAWSEPQAPKITESEQVIKSYHKKQEEIGKDAAFPAAWSLPLFFVGMAGAIGSAAVLMAREF